MALTVPPPWGWWVLTTGWVVTMIGLSVATVGFWRMSRSSLEQDTGAEPSTWVKLPFAELNRLRGPKTSILVGYLVLAIGTAMGEWASHGWDGDHLMKGILLYDIAVVVSFALIGSAWWLYLQEMPASAREHQSVRRALRIFGTASGVLAVGNLVLLAEGTSFYEGLNQWSLVLCAAGLAVVATGFLRASTGPGGPHSSLATEAELEPST